MDVFKYLTVKEGIMHIYLFVLYHLPKEMVLLAMTKFDHQFFQETYSMYSLVQI